MLRREFLQKTAAAVAASGIPIHADQLAGMRKRVGLIGTGWYGKSDLLRMVQVAPINVAGRLSATMAPSAGEGPLLLTVTT